MAAGIVLSYLALRPRAAARDAARAAEPGMPATLDATREESGEAEPAR